MTDRDRFELEMSPGMEPPSGLGDRVLIGLAVVALVGGALIAVGNVLPDADEVAEASEAPSSRPARTPRPSPTPQQPRVAALVEPDIELIPQQPSFGFDGWIRALADLPIRGSPVLDAPEIGVFEQGEIAYVSGPEDASASGWLLLQERGGWIAGTVGGVDVIRRYEYPRFRYSGWINSVTAGPEGFVAILSEPGSPDVNEPPRPATSTDGATWRSADTSPFSSWTGVSSIAWGPAGWLAAEYVSDDTKGGIWIWSSPDGLAWTRLGMLEAVRDELAMQLLASDRGYLMETFSQGRSFSASGTLWSSPDGLLWRESTDPLLGHRFQGERRIASLREGFYLWDGGQPSGLSSFAAFSVDGLSWNEVEIGPNGANLQLTSHAGRLVAIDADRKTLAPRVWSGVVADREVIWVRETAGEAVFAGAVTRQLVSDGTRLFAFGWDLATEEALVWTRNGQQWVRASLPDSFGGFPLVAAAGPNGAVVVGYRHSLRGDNPVFWHRSATGRWLPEADPILVAVPDPSGDDCPALPDEFLEYIVVDAAAVVSCHGATPITFRAYSVVCNNCSGTLEGNPQPEWLLNPNDHLWLSPDDAHLDWSAAAVLDPSLIPLDPAWTGAWLGITGHFDDPAAATCHRELVADEIAYWYGVQSFIDQCRMTFVVTDVTVISAP